MQPIILITTGYARVMTQGGELPSCCGGAHCAAAIHRAGGVPIYVPSIPDRVREYGRLMHGLVLAGGGDVGAVRGSRLYAEGQDVDRRRDEIELLLIELAKKQRVPILAICRGIQILNVALGGTLLGDLGRRHMQESPGLTTSHSIEVKPDSRLARTFTLTKLRVNSFHHQAVEETAVGLEATAWASDDVIEAVESCNREWWCIGVQWHADIQQKTDPVQFELFRDFVGSAEKNHLGIVTR